MKLDRSGTAGAIVAAILCPICFPKLALVGSALGLGVLAPYEGWFAAAAQVFLLVALAGHGVTFRRHRDRRVLALAAVGVALVLGSLWLYYVEALVYAGLAALIAATVWSAFVMRACASCDAVVEPAP
jgi:mercuric ion transport protein